MNHGLIKTALILTAAGFSGGCEQTAIPTDLATSPTMQQYDPEQFPGVWLARGYGTLIDSKAEPYRLFSYTDSVCTPDSDELLIEAFLDLARSEANGAKLVLASRLDPYEYVFDRLPELPENCLQPPSDSARVNFDAFAAFFSSHYAFFDLYAVNWPQRVQSARHRVDPDWTDAELYTALSELIAPLKDSHIKIEASFDGEEHRYDGNQGPTEQAIAEQAQRNGLSLREFTGQFRRNYWFESIAQGVLKSNGQIAANSRIQYGLATPDIGFFAVVSMGGFFDGDESELAQELDALAPVLDEAITLYNANRVKAVIVDLSLNSGGYDFIAAAIAARFTDQPHLAYTRRAADRADGEAWPVVVQPANGARYSGPVYQLTSNLTVSAGEVLTLALRALPGSVHAGEPTRGALSTMLEKTLPNGWTFALSNEVFTDFRGVLWEGRGIEPERPLQVFDPADLMGSHLRAVQQLIAMIESDTHS